MALLQERYVSISSGKGSTPVAQRNLQALVFTDSPSDKYGTDNLVSCANATAVATAFGESSKEYLWASKYFGYSDPNGNAPTRLTFAKMANAETPRAAFSRIVKKTNDFGVFSFLVEMDASKIKDVAEANAALNYRFQFVAPITDAMIKTKKTEADPIKAIKTACVGADGSCGTQLVYQKKVVYTATSTDAVTVPKTYILAAVLSSIDWDQEDGTVSPMFRSVSGTDADVESAESTCTNAGAGGAYDWTYTEVGADDLDKLDINYYGRVQINGAERCFYQKGMNTDGEPALVYMGEAWLKSEISTRILQLMLSISKIKANVEGNAKVYATIDSVCAKGVMNGTIEPGKDLDTTTILAINSVAGDTSAADIVYNRGYWLKSWIEYDEDGKNYKAKYLLLYSKEDVVVKVEGSDILY